MTTVIIDNIKLANTVIENEDLEVVNTEKKTRRYVNGSITTYTIEFTDAEDAETFAEVYQMVSGCRKSVTNNIYYIL